VSSVQDLEHLSSLIDHVYLGATDASLWPDIIAHACGWLGSPKGMLYTPLHGGEQGGFYFQHGLTDSFLELYKAKYQAVDLWTQAVVRRKLFTEGTVLLGTDLVPHDTLVASPWYRDCLEMGDISRLLTSVVFSLQDMDASPRIADMPTACSFYRRSIDEDYTELERRKLALLVPHFSRALGVMTRLRLGDLKVASSLSALDRLPTAVLLLSAAGDVLFSNRAATAMLAGSDALRIEPTAGARGLGRLVAKRASVNREIARALSGAGGIDDVLHFSSVIKVPGRVVGQDWLVQLSRVGLGSAFSAEGEVPEVIAFLTDPRRPLDLAPDMLSRTYGLTPAEARAAVAATGGGSIDEIAARLALSPNTVKTQLKQVYAKTGAGGRADLVRLILGLATVH
jgi:DNA-binding CsgD family transcriptional regulator